MGIPELHWKHIRHVDFQSNDKVYLVKEIQKIVADVVGVMSGDCPHRPDEIRLLKDQESNKAAGSQCVWCSQEIEIKKIVWGPKSKFPVAPKSA